MSAASRFDCVWPVCSFRTGFRQAGNFCRVFRVSPFRDRGIPARWWRYRESASCRAGSAMFRGGGYAGIRTPPPRSGSVLPRPRGGSCPASGIRIFAAYTRVPNGCHLLRLYIISYSSWGLGTAVPRAHESQSSRPAALPGVCDSTVRRPFLYRLSACCTPARRRYFCRKLFLRPFFTHLFCQRFDT